MNSLASINFSGNFYVNYEKYYLIDNPEFYILIEHLMLNC